MQIFNSVIHKYVKTSRTILQTLLSAFNEKLHVMMTWTWIVMSSDDDDDDDEYNW
jgi:hypothetical protein